MTSNRFVRHAPILASLLLAGCSHHVPDATIDVIDTSLSITPRAEKAALDAVRNQIGQMQRGDLLVLIPITGDASDDAGGRILRLTAPTEREPYDTDLRRFQERAQKQFAAWTASLDQHQVHTDILGALDAARQEFALFPKESNSRLIVVSDFLEDDGTYRFVSAGSLTNPAHARDLAVRLRKEHRLTLQGVSLCLGRLESADYAPLSEQRKAATQAFWAEYFSQSDHPAEVHFDGTGMLADPQRGCIGGKQ